MVKFLDTCALLELQDKIFESNDKIIISSISIKELEQIKTSAYKDGEIKWTARHLLKLLSENEDKYEIEMYKNHYEEELRMLDLPLSDDSKIIVCAEMAFVRLNCLETGIFITQDLACKKLAECIGLKTEFINLQDDDEYTGYKIIDMSESEISEFYSKIFINNENRFNLLENEYLLIKCGEYIIDKYKWAEGKYKRVLFNAINSSMFGQIKPYNNDDLQQCAIDSLFSNQVTVLRGLPGSGKTYLGLGYLVSLLEKNKIDCIIIFCNTVAVRGAAKLGFYPGSRDEKLLDSQIGNLLATKFGSITEVERMIEEGKLILVPVADCRGMDTTGLNAGIFVTESQNLSRDMIKLILQRIGEDSVVVFDGDDKTQVDMSEYAGINNGLKAMSRAFRGSDIYGEVTLDHIYRSKIAELANNI